MAKIDTAVTRSATVPQRSKESLRDSIPKTAPRISIVDHTLPVEESGQSQSSKRPSLDNVPGSSIAGSRIKTSRTRSATLRDQKARWKYGKYTEERASDRPISRQQTAADGLPAEAAHDLTLTESKWGQNALDRGKRKIQTKVLRQKRTRTIQDRDTEIDVLYENQRGAFFCGIPLFSPKALNPTDPTPWVDGNFKKSRENITNAQVPDPSWEWVWRTWYVDMSRDVDEEGWEYSFFFKGFSWHGTHPWFHSFVRRRRWIRKRIRKSQDKDMTDPHDLTRDYFTIHTGRTKAARDLAGSSTGESQPRKWGEEQKAEWEEDDLTDIGTLIHALKVAPVDSERIALIKNFLEHGGDDLYYLADEMPNIMSYFFHEHSCRRLLALLTDKIEEANRHLQEHKDSGEPQNADEERYTNALLKAAKSVDDQCKQLQFWSDARDVPRMTKVSFSHDDELSRYESASEHTPQATADNQKRDEKSAASSSNSGQTAKEDKGKAPIRPDTAASIGGVDGTFDNSTPFGAYLSPEQPHSRRGSQDTARSRASRASLGRAISQADSGKLVELIPEPLNDPYE